MAGNWAFAAVRLSVLLGSLFIPAACEKNADEGPPVADQSVGVRVVENDRRMGGADTVVAREVALRIGADGDARYEFAQIRSVLPLPDGTIAVANGGSFEVRFYSQYGEYLHAIGGRGEGPGEFAALGSLHQLGADTLLAGDARLRRLSIIAPGGAVIDVLDYAQHLALDPPELGQCIIDPALRGILGDRTLVLIGWQCVEARGIEGTRQATADLILRNPAAGGDKVLSSFWKVDVYELPTGAPQVFRPLPLSGGMSMTVAPEGIYATPGDAYSILIYRPDGELDLVIRDVAPRQPIDAGVRQRFAEGLSTFERSFYDGLPYPDSLPAFRRLVVGGDHIWANHYELEEGAPDHWTVYEKTGARVGLVAFPGEFRLMAVANGKAYGVSRHQLGIERVEVYRIPLDAADP